MVGRVTSILLASGAALVSIAAAPDDAKEEMIRAFDAVLTGMAAAGIGLCFFAIVWAGFLLMAEGAEGEGRGRARNAVIMAVVGLVVVLLAKGIAARPEQRTRPHPAHPVEQERRLSNEAEFGKRQRTPET